MHRNKNGSNKLPKHSFICNACVCYDSRTDEVLNKDKCENCNGNGKEWQPRNSDFYKKDPYEFMKNLILGSQ